MDTFDEVRENVKRFVKVNAEMGGNSKVHIHHLITNIENKARKIDLYR